MHVALATRLSGCLHHRSALWNGSAAGGGACSALGGLHSLAPLQRASLVADMVCGSMALHSTSTWRVWLQSSKPCLPHWPCGVVVQQEVVLAMLWLGSIHRLLCSVLHLLRMVCSLSGACNSLGRMLRPHGHPLLRSPLPAAGPQRPLLLPVRRPPCHVRTAIAYEAHAHRMNLVRVPQVRRAVGARCAA